ncbi:MAG: hypothetical protein L0Y72_17065 [Gemmataceae bacterium]|nr:hypothetical protein [Gemmataceae bacterium]MCI0740763.1 hypothetical protein [Gemmataceae bacterium]
MPRHPLRRNGEPSTGRPSEQDQLRQRVRTLESEKRLLLKERDAYRQALMARWKKESRAEDWSDFDPADYKYSLADIFAEFEKEEGVCLPRHRNIASSTPAKSKKSSKSSSAKRRKRAS